MKAGLEEAKGGLGQKLRKKVAEGRGQGGVLVLNGEEMVEGDWDLVVAVTDDFDKYKQLEEGLQGRGFQVKEAVGWQMIGGPVQMGVVFKKK
jgi:hypothetical protein